MDASVRRVLLQAIRARRVGRGVTAWVPSPPGEFRLLDKGGRTAHERAFTRSAYYQVTKTSPTPLYSLKLTWGKLERRGTQYGRRVRVRVYRYGSGEGHVKKKVREPWIEDIDAVGSWRAGTRRSLPGDRIDSR
jgi:hypothetical protein